MSSPKFKVENQELYRPALAHKKKITKKKAAVKAVHLINYTWPSLGQVSICFPPLCFPHPIEGDRGAEAEEHRHAYNFVDRLLYICK